jgi:hypothetical protein
LSTQCLAPDNGGTADLPAQCPYHGQIQITGGLPPGQSLVSIAELGNFQSVSSASGGTLGGDSITAEAEMLLLQLNGIGGLNYSRTLTIPILMFEMHTAPRPTGSPVLGRLTSATLILMCCRSRQERILGSRARDTLP